MTNSSSFPSRKLAWLALVVITLATLAIVLLPVWIIHPFSPQTRRGLEISYAMKRWSPVLTLVSATTALILVVWLWRNSRRWWRKALTTRTSSCATRKLVRGGNRLPVKRFSARSKGNA